MTYEVEIGNVSIGRIPQVRIHNEAGTVFEGALPPYVTKLAPAPRLPRVDLDVIWKMAHIALDEVTWVQHFRDGTERLDRLRPCRNRLELEIPYSLMIEICYGGVPFDEALDPSIVMTFIGQLSCLTGLLHGPDTTRLGSLDQGAMDALILWSSGGQSERTR